MVVAMIGIQRTGHYMLVGRSRCKLTTDGRLCRANHNRGDDDGFA